MSGLMSDQKKMEGRNHYFWFIYGNWTKLDVLHDMSAFFSEQLRPGCVDPKHQPFRNKKNINNIFPAG